MKIKLPCKHEWNRTFDVYIEALDTMYSGNASRMCQKCLDIQTITIETKEAK